jgi:hypothetical protein
MRWKSFVVPLGHALLGSALMFLNEKSIAMNDALRHICVTDPEKILTHTAGYYCDGLGGHVRADRIDGAIQAVLWAFAGFFGARAMKPRPRDSEISPGAGRPDLG